MEGGARLGYLLVGHAIVSGVQHIGPIYANPSHIPIVFGHNKGEGIEEQARNEAPEPPLKHNVVG